ncbi:MAG: alpha-ketoacid dehydrogenase subunit beta [Acidimicrobiaceae bacterium]|nr:alpha-ketoacid dehydrogenase subunit beta [Acidimicrobiaceae bacterium]
MGDSYLVTAMRDGLAEAMREDPAVVLFGEDADRSVMGSTRGLIDEFGPDRVRNIPLSEATIVGCGVGAAAAGLRPVIDLMVSSFFYVTMDQLANQAAKLRYMSGGQVELPIVYFAATGGAGSAAAQHSESPHPTFIQQAGLKVVMPSTPADAKGLMLAAVRDPNPVVYLQEASLGGTRGPVPEGLFEVPLGQAAVRRNGSDVTVVAVGRTVRVALAVAEELDGEGVSVEVIDPRTLHPWDAGTVMESVARTGRLVVLDTARQSCGFAAEVIATACTEAFGSLRAAPVRVCAPDVPMPFAPQLERHLAVDEHKVKAAVLRSLA